MNWKEDIPGTFGSADLIFAGHPCDAERALDLLKECYQSNVSLQDVLDEVEKFLKLKGAGAQHIRDQINKINDKFSGWLD